MGEHGTNAERNVGNFRKLLWVKTGDNMGKLADFIPSVDNVVADPLKWSNPWALPVNQRSRAETMACVGADLCGLALRLIAGGGLFFSGLA